MEQDPWPAGVMITALGSVGVGLMWGWLAGHTLGRAKRSLKTGLLLGAATVLLAVCVGLAVGRQLLPLFLGSTVLALFLNLLWRQRLRKRIS